jgi:hypothetical protein
VLTEVDRIALIPESGVSADGIGSNPGPATTSELRNYSGVTRLRRGVFYQPSLTAQQVGQPGRLPAGR